MDYFTTTEAAKLLAKELPERTENEWLMWLANNRNPKRAVSFRVAVKPGTHRVLYPAASLTNLINMERAKKTQRLLLTSSDADNFVLTVGDSPQVAIRLNKEQAEELQNQLHKFFNKETP